MFKQWMVGVFVTGVLASSAANAADDSGFYVGAGFGQAYNEVGRFSLEDSVVKAFVGFIVKNDGERETASESDDDFAWGLGTAVKIGRLWSLRFEYESVAVSEGEFEAVTLSGTVRF
jgi:opacity protein-like surface antigen